MLCSLVSMTESAEDVVDKVGNLTLGEVDISLG